MSQTEKVDDEAISQLSEAELRSARWTFASSPKTGVRYVNRIRELVIRFFFYYPRDYGFGGHEHDLEGLEVYLRPTLDGDAFRINRIAASAHGVSWYTNEFDVRSDSTLSLPLHVFVEEGKHATAPDPDASGTYDHGSDVNNYVADSWGVRDQNARDWSTFGRFRPRMFKSRASGNVSAPAWISIGVQLSSRYALRPSTESPLCSESGFDGLPDTLQRFARYMQFCSAHELGFKKLRPNAFVRSARALVPLRLEPYADRPFSLYSLLSYSYRTDGTRQLSQTFPLWRVPGRGWVAFRYSFPIRYNFSLNNRTLREQEVISYDFLYSPSVAQWVDGYVAAGWDTSQEPTRTDRAFEAGFRVGIPIPGFHDWLPPMVTLRAGLRRSAAMDPRRWRPVLQASFGVW